MTARLSPSKTWLRNLNTRQRKKLHLAEFQERGNEISVVFAQALAIEVFEPFLHALIDEVESRKLIMSCLGGSFPVTEVEAFISRGRGQSPSQEDIAALMTWIKARPEVSSAEAGESIDAWYAC